MTKEEIVKIIVIALIGSFSKSFFDNILGKYIPDKKKLNSYILKFLLFALRYILPMYFLISAFLDSEPIDKKFVLIVSIFTTVVFFNVLIDIFSYYYSHYKYFSLKVLDTFERQNEIIKTMDDTDNKIIDKIEEINTNNADKPKKKK